MISFLSGYISQPTAISTTEEQVNKRVELVSFREEVDIGILTEQATLATGPLEEGLCHRAETFQIQYGIKRGRKPPLHYLM